MSFLYASVCTYVDPSQQIEFSKSMWALAIYVLIELKDLHKTKNIDVDIQRQSLQLELRMD